MTKKIDYLSLQDLIHIGNEVIADFRIRDIGLLESAANRPQTTVFGEDAYPNFSEKVAALLQSVARNHALIDGNKRLAWASSRVFCLMNGYDLSFNHDQAYEMVIDAASGVLDVQESSKLIEKYLVSAAS